MIFTKSKEYEDIVRELDKSADVITIITCTSCARFAGTGSDVNMKKLALRLREDGYNVLDGYSINAVCTPVVMRAAIDKRVNTLVVMSCAGGLSSVKEDFPGYKIVGTTYDVGLMSADNRVNEVTVRQIFAGSEDACGKQFEMFTGKPKADRKDSKEAAR